MQFRRAPKTLGRRTQPRLAQPRTAGWPATTNAIPPSRKRSSAGRNQHHDLSSPRSTERWLPASGRGRGEVIWLGLCVPGGLVFVRAEVAELALDAAGVVPAVMATEDARTSRRPLSLGIEIGASLRTVTVVRPLLNVRV
jgi:hypothetical protein